MSAPRAAPPARPRKRAAAAKVSAASATPAAGAASPAVAAGAAGPAATKSAKPATPAAKTQTGLKSRLAKLGIQREFDLVLHLPLRHEDETRLTPIAEADSGAPVQVEGQVIDSDVKFRPRRQLVARIADDTGSLGLRFFNFYPNQAKALTPGVRVRAFGEVKGGFFGAEMIHPRFQVVRGDMPLPRALTPIYPTTAGLSQAALRTLIDRALGRARLDETVPREILAPLRLPPLAQALHALHHPLPEADAQALQDRSDPAWLRVKFDELLAQQLSMRLHYRERRARSAPRLLPGAPASAPTGAPAPALPLTQALLASLPFRLTAAQLRAWEEIARDLAAPHPMHRLLQGDVGSGKTIVAALAVLRAVECGFQAAVMAPTEILAEQHQRKFSEWLAPLGVRLAWLSGSQGKAARRQALADIESGAAQVVVGTHALFQEQVRMQRLGLVIVDEQHRFGVAQRLALRDKARGAGEAGVEEAHQLMMSATPIPRTLSMSYYADLDVSVIDELPPGRTPVTTKLVSDGRRADVLRHVREACASGRQAYWVCPLIEESETLQLQTAVETHARLAEEFPDLQVGLVHGRMTPAEKAQVMQAFISGTLQLLVATTVIEVGVDVPNASLMVIEHAERFGLAQLHQLRGRVGRGAARSACILIYKNPLSEGARARLKVIYENSDGFAIAAADLDIRGPGEYLGARQSGAPLLRFADLGIDADLVLRAREAAERMLDAHAELAQAHLERWLGGRADFMKA